MHWLKLMEPKSYNQLQKTYTSSLNKLYERDLARFLEEAYARYSFHFLQNFLQNYKIVNGIDGAR